MKSQEFPLRCIAFDLDDTLLDTTNIFVPLATEKAFEILKELPLNYDLETFNNKCKQLAKTLSHPEIFSQLVSEKSARSAELVKKATLAFYTPQIPPKLPLLPDALENLLYLKKNYLLFLVTSGLPDVQTRKIAACGIQDFFERCFVIENLKGERKKTAFESIIRDLHIQPSQLLSCGNRLALETRDAKLCGAKTCYFKYGEHVGEFPTQPEDVPDYTITHHRELITTCQL
jgi:putative hydrolase of the HAD superfamily